MEFSLLPIWHKSVSAMVPYFRSCFPVMHTAVQCHVNTPCALDELIRMKEVSGSVAGGGRA